MRAPIILLISLLSFSLSGQKIPEKIYFESLDGLKISADCYLIEDAAAPFIILFHQARYSRGEYLEIAPKLNDMGFNCIAVDQRSGKEVNGVENETYQRAVDLEKNTEYVDAWPDLVASMKFVKNEYRPKQIIIWGSSYSSALAFVLAASHKSDVDAILSFSPGNYFRIEGNSISDYAKSVKCPVFITSSTSEKKQWVSIFENLKSEKKYYFLPEDEGFHGSKALWEENEGNENYWKSVEEFLFLLKEE